MASYLLPISIAVDHGQSNSVLQRVKGSIVGMSTDWASGTDPVFQFDVAIGSFHVTQAPIDIRTIKNSAQAGGIKNPYIFPMGTPYKDIPLTVTFYNTDAAIDGTCRLTFLVRTIE